MQRALGSIPSTTRVGGKEGRTFCAGLGKKENLLSKSMLKASEVVALRTVGVQKGSS
jgi:hypothetical protein